MLVFDTTVLVFAIMVHVAGLLQSAAVCCAALWCPVVQCRVLRDDVVCCRAVWGHVLSCAVD